MKSTRNICVLSMMAFRLDYNTSNTRRMEYICQLVDQNKYEYSHGTVLYGTVLGQVRVKKMGMRFG